MLSRRILKAIACMLVGVTLLCSCANGIQKSDLKGGGSEISSQTEEGFQITSFSSGESSIVDTQKLTQNFLAWAKEFHGFNEGESDPEATFNGEKLVDGEPWYELSYNVSFIQGEYGKHLVTADLSRIYVKVADQQLGLDTWARVKDTITEKLEPRVDDISNKFCKLAMEKDFGENNSISVLGIMIVDSRMCWVAELESIEDNDRIPLATYALTIDETEYYRLGNDQVYHLVNV